MAYTAALMEPSIDVDKLSYEIFTILESEFLKLGASSPVKPPASGKVRILSIDAGVGSLLAAASLSRLESHLREMSGNHLACVADFFDLAAGSGSGGLLAAMLFTRGPEGTPLFTAEEALRFLAKKPDKCILRRLLARSGGAGFRRVFGDLTLRDAVKPLLVPCYDVATGSAFMFSRADAVEGDGYDFAVRDVCTATCGEGAVEVRSVDGSTRVVAVGGAAAMANPAAAAITHVLNNKREFPMANGVEDLLVMSIGGGEAVRVGRRGRAPPSTAEMVRIAGEGTADTVDQMVAMAFGHKRTTNYIRVQANGLGSGKTVDGAAATAAATLLEKNVESMLFQGRMVSEKTNGEKLEDFAGELVREDERRMGSGVQPVAIKSATTPSRMSTATIGTISTRTSMTTHSSLCLSR